MAKPTDIVLGDGDVQIKAADRLVVLTSDLELWAEANAPGGATKSQLHSDARSNMGQMMRWFSIGTATTLPSCTQEVIDNITAANLAFLAPKGTEVLVFLWRHCRHPI